MLGILNQTQNWGSEVQKYEQEKKSLAWKFNVPQKIITSKEVKEKDNLYNPILQVYKNKEYEDFLQERDRKKFLDTLASNKDNALRYEQTFDILNLKDKLKGMEKHQNYPRIKSENERRKKLDKNNLTYNLLSNITLDKHNFLKPENRPVIDEKPPSRKIKSVSSHNYRDYNIISNKYKDFNDEKRQAENEICKLQAAIAYSRQNIYNPIQAKLVDDSKEKEYQNKREEEAKKWGRAHRKQIGEGNLYNPINMSIVDDTELRIADQRAKNKKKRFQIRYEIEQHYQEKNSENKNYKDDIINKKFSYQRFKEIDKRGFNILNNDEKNFKEYKNENGNSKSDWDKLVNFAGEKNTFKDKPLYKDPYDYSDLNIYTNKFKNERKKLLEKLPNIKDDASFNGMKTISKKLPQETESSEDIKNRNRLAPIDKDKWFKTHKEKFYHQGAVEKVDYHQDKRISTSNCKIIIRPTMFLENKLNRNNEKISEQNS